MPEIISHTGRMRWFCAIGTGAWRVEVEVLKAEAFSKMGTKES